MYFAKFNVNERIFETYDNEKLMKDFLKDIIANLKEDFVICYNEKTKNVDDVFKIKDIKKLGEETVEPPDKNCSYYKFMQLNFIQKNGDEIINGRLTRIYADDWHRFVVSEDGEESLSDQYTPDKASYITFSFNVYKEVIGFSTRQDFSKEKFLKVFKLLVEACTPNIGEVELILLIDSARLESKWERMNELYELSVELIAPNGSNPQTTKIMAALKNEIHGTRATSATLNLKSQKSNSLEKASDLIETVIKMVKLGYAKLKAKGVTKRKEGVKIDTASDVNFTYPISDKLKNDFDAVGEKTDSAILYYQRIIEEEVNSDE